MKCLLLLWPCVSVNVTLSSFSTHCSCDSHTSLRFTADFDGILSCHLINKFVLCIVSPGVWSFSTPTSPSPPWCHCTPPSSLTNHTLCHNTHWPIRGPLSACPSCHSRLLGIKLETSSTLFLACCLFGLPAGFCFQPPPLHCVQFVAISLLHCLTSDSHRGICTPWVFDCACTNRLHWVWRNMWRHV